ncbi:DUF3291 domain-containing protein [Saccharopolyspora shandongensis]|uniref:DUF3291 domain-containing protein n=1 Tax=Saccharopolyspora shandongensis TaxID=418495 RepID=UPI0033DB12B6
MGGIWFTSWRPGPEPGGAAVVSVTEFAPHRPWTMIGVSLAGVALRRSWPDLEGAVGMWLWTVPGLRRPRSGSVSVWRDEEALRRFVGRPDHVRIMRAYRDRGALRSTMWRIDRLDRPAVREAARALIAGRSAWPS